MDFDVEDQLSAVERSVSPTMRDGQAARAVALSRSYATTAGDLWDAVTNGERLPRWFLPISGELELGGRYQLEGNAGGLITACERPSHLALTWEFGGDESWVEVDFSDDVTGRARLALTHTAHLSEHWDTYGPGAVGVGWELALMGWRSTWRNRQSRSRTKPRSPLHRTAGRSSWEAARRGRRQPSPPEPTATPRARRHGARPRSIPENRPSSTEAPAV